MKVFQNERSEVLIADYEGNPLWLVNEEGVTVDLSLEPGYMTDVPDGGGYDEWVEITRADL